MRTNFCEIWIKLQQNSDKKNENVVCKMAAICVVSNMLILVNTQSQHVFEKYI